MSVTLQSLIFYCEFEDVALTPKRKVKGSSINAVLLAMADAANDEGFSAYNSITTLEVKTNLSRSAVKYTIQACKKAGLIEYQGVSPLDTSDYSLVIPEIAKRLTTKSVRLPRNLLGYRVTQEEEGRSQGDPGRSQGDPPLGHGETQDRSQGDPNPSLPTPEPPIHTEIRADDHGEPGELVVTMRDPEPREPDMEEVKAAAAETMAGILGRQGGYEQAKKEGKAWKYRAKFPEMLLPLADKCAAKFGPPSKKDLIGWLTEIGDWYDRGGIPEDFDEAIRLTKGWNSRPVSPYSLTRTISTVIQDRLNEGEPEEQPELEYVDGKPVWR